MKSKSEMEENSKRHRHRGRELINVRLWGFYSYIFDRVIENPDFLAMYNKDCGEYVYGSNTQ